MRYRGNYANREYTIIYILRRVEGRNRELQDQQIAHGLRFSDFVAGTRSLVRLVFMYFTLYSCHSYFRPQRICLLPRMISKLCDE